MPKKGHSEEQILRALRQAESGARVSEIFREYGISEATFYVWKKKYSTRQIVYPGLGKAVRKLDLRVTIRSDRESEQLHDRRKAPGRIAQGGKRSLAEEVDVPEGKTFVGVDVSKQRLEVAVRPNGEVWSESNDLMGVRRLVRRLKAMVGTLIVIEATGGYQNHLSAALRDAELPVRVVNPRWVRDFARAHGQLAKTDKLDAKL